MSRPSISLACIMKNESHNLSRFLQSVRGCFDEIILVDTGSTDGSVAFVESINERVYSGDPNWAGLPEIKIRHFEWIQDFAAARNFAFSHATQDYVAWLDLDDELNNSTAFIQWRDSVMHSAHYWVATYNYSFDKDKKPECVFIRERVVRRDYGFKWEYFVHEGLIQTEGRKFWPQKVNSWTVDHVRTEEDKKTDHLRNLKIFEAHDLETMHSRMKFYYGKELFENGFPEKAGKPLMEALADKGMDQHDRILSIQYAAQSAFSQKAYAQAINLLMNGLQLMLQRAEYWCLLGDVHLATNNIGDARTAYRMALQCGQNTLGGALVCYNHAYGEYPHTQLCHIALQNGDANGAKEHLDWLEKFGSSQFTELTKSYHSALNLSTIRTDLAKTDDIIITCPPHCAVTDWDEHSLASKGQGGSETAAIEVARWLKLKTKRKVKIFHQRASRDVMPSGVEYLPISELAGYLHNVEPYVNINWRHATKLTNAKSYVWCHDLQCPGAERAENYDKIIALSEFHSRYLQETQNIPNDKITLGFNGINPADFAGDHGPKDPLKVIFSSSPDRGLVQVIDIVKKAREISGLDIKLHCFYGVANMRKMGHTEWADSIEKKIKENDFVTYYGNVSKQVLMKHFWEASTWIYPADFIESSCLTALEAMYTGCWSIVRPMGALPFTMKPAIVAGMCDMIDVEVVDEASIGIWANALVEAVIDRKYQKVEVPMTRTWESVADFFIKEFKL